MLSFKRYSGHSGENRLQGWKQQDQLEGYCNKIAEKVMAPHSSTLAWKIPWTEEPGRLQSMGSLTRRLHFHCSLSCTGEGNGNPLQYSCLENPLDGGAWQATVHGVAKSWTRLSDFTFTLLLRERNVEIRIIGTSEIINLQFKCQMCEYSDYGKVH